MPRTILVTGRCGSGKSTLLRVGQPAMARYLGRTATNTALTPEATVAEIAIRVERGEGRITGPLPQE